MTDLIRVQPTTANRRDFARWAVTQTPKIGTIGLFIFGVPPHLFVEAPEHLLIGALVDGHRYVSPDEDAAEERPGPGELLGVASPEALTPPAVGPEAEAAALIAATPPDLVERAMTAVVVATELAASNAGAAAGGDGSDPSDSPGDFAPLDDAPAEDEGPPYGCDVCPRTFPTERGRDTHRRQAHRED